MNVTDRVHSILDLPLSLLRVLLGSKYNVSLPKNEREDLFIIANGPSTKRINPNNLKGKTVLAVNQFASTALFEAIQPKYYVLAAPEYWMKDINEHFLKVARQPTFKGLSQKVSWEMFVFVDYQYRNSTVLQSLRRENANLKFIFINLTPLDDYNALNKFLFNRKLGLPRPHNVIIPSIFVGLWLNFRRIYLFGADHSWLPTLQVADDNRVFIEQIHFYDEGKTKARPMKNIKFQDRRLHEILHKFYLSFKAYHDIAQYAKDRKVMIINVTNDSFIDAFERMKIDDFFNNSL